MIGVIADDLTGAAEIGAVGLRHGWRAEIVVASGETGSEFRLQEAGGARPPEGGTPTADMICVDTDSRSCAPAEAARRVAAAAKALKAAGAEWIYKKVDSVLRGPVTAELVAIMEELRFRRALLVPANPALDRIIRDGHYFICGRPIHQTEFARDPEYPRISSDVTQLLDHAETFPIRICRVGDVVPGDGIGVGETATVDDLRHWAKLRGAGLLPAGGSGFFSALLTEAAYAPAAPAAAGSIAVPGPRELFVCGTLSESAREFLNTARQRGTPAFALSTEPGGAGASAESEKALAGEIVNAFQSQRRVHLALAASPRCERSEGRRLAEQLARVVGAVLRQVDVGQVFAEGGATAVALVRHLGWHRLSVLKELAPGVATLAVGGTGSTWLTIKPGSYLWPSEIRNPSGPRPG